MFVALAVPLVAVTAGTLLALAGGASPRVLVPVRSFALAAVLVAVLTHLLPEAIATGGPWALAVFAAGFAAPQLIGRMGARAGRHARLATELGFLGVVLHQVGDGLALGAFRGHWDVVIAIGVHTVPLAAAVALGMVPLHGRRGTIVRAGVLAAATVAGVIVTGTGGPMIASGVAPWINAAVAGLLVHVLSHDLPTPARTGTAPLIEVLAVAAGVAIPVLAAHGEADAGGLIAAMREVIELVAVPLVIGLAASIGLEIVGERARARLLRTGTAAGGVAAAAVASTCSCRVVPAARALTGRGRPAAVIAFVLVAPELGLDTILVGTQVLGVELALIRVAAAIGIAVVAATVADRLARDPGDERRDHEDRHERDDDRDRRHDHDRDHDHGVQIGQGHGHGHGHGHGEAGGESRRLVTRIDELIIHGGPWIAVGLVAAALLLVALPPDALAGSGWLAGAVVLALAVPAYVCAPAATPVAAVLIARGLAPGAAIAGLLLGAATNRAGLVLLARAYGATAVVAAIGVVGALAIGTGVVIELAGAAPHGAPLWPFTGPVATAAALVLGAVLARGIWRYGLGAWLEPLHGGDHRHHQHPAGAPCGPGCHDH